MKTQLQLFIEQNPQNWEAVLSQKPFSLSIRRDEQYPNLVLFMYHQFETDFNIPLCKEARGIILDISNPKDTADVCRAFDKFFNHGESRAAVIDWPSARVLEKVDGSILKLFYYNGRWMWATNGTIDAVKTQLPSDVGPFQMFGKLAWDCFTRQAGLFILTELNQSFTYIFELQSPWNRVVVPVEKQILTFLGSRNNITGLEYLPTKSLGFPIPKETSEYFYGTSSFPDLSSILDNIKQLPYNQEGYVVCDKDFNRVKIKGLAYLAAHHLADNGNVSRARVLELVKTGEDGEFLAYFPEYAEVFNDVKKKYTDLLTRLSGFEDWVADAKIKFGVDRKAFALWAQSLEDKTLMPFAFVLYDNNKEKYKLLVEKINVDWL